ncbi:MAG: SurA N-terminal domain-containing protein [Vampirovibrionales bacterium]|nr:SurA N-terminal domain-containing protein [Vampirovibrionales bacterium]
MSFIRSRVLPLSLSFLLSLSALAFAGCQMVPGLSQQLDPRSKETVLTIDGQVVNKLQYDEVFAQYAKLLKVAENPELSKNPVIQETLKQMALNKLVLKNLIAQEAKALGLVASDEDVKALRKDHALKAGGEKALEDMLAKNQFSDASFEEALKEQVLNNKLVDALAQKSGNASLKATEAEAKAFYAKNPDIFKMPPSIRAHHILLKAIDAEMKKALRAEHPKWDEAQLEKALIEKKSAQKAKAAKLFEEVKKNPAAIEKLAKNNSDDLLSAEKDGDLGFLVEQTTEPTFWAAMVQTPPGKLYPGVVESPFGFHIIRVDEKKKAETVSFEKAKADIQSRLSEQKKQAVLETWLKQKMDNTKVVIEPAYQPKAQDNAVPGAPNQAPAAPEAKKAG